MRKEKGFFFAPEITFEDFASYLQDHQDPEQFDKLIKAFKKRVSSLFLEPAALLAEKNHDFAVGLMCCCVIDLLATLQFAQDMDDMEDRIYNWLTEYVEESREIPITLGEGRSVARRVAHDFRHALVHGGSIGGLGQFSSEENELWRVGKAPWVGLIINPRLLLERVEKGLEKYCVMLTTPVQKEKFIKQIKLQFEPELSAVSSRKSKRLKSSSSTPPRPQRRL